MLHMSVSQAQKEISSREFVEWQAAENILGPLGIWRIDIIGAIVAAAATNAQRTRDEQVDAKHFIPEFGKEPEEPAPVEDKVHAVMASVAHKLSS